MCDDRERLISYIYGESDIRERRDVDAHLASCAACRAEVADLRAVREDLLAWDVPEHGSVWRPFAPVRVAPSWRDLPTWGLAAAAALLLVAGAAGGIATRAFWPQPSAPPATMAAVSDRDALSGPPPIAVVAPPRPVEVVSPAPLTRDDLAQLEARVLERMRAEMDERVRDAQIDFAWKVNGDLQQITRRQVNLEQRNNQNNLILTSMLASDDAGLTMGR